MAHHRGPFPEGNLENGGSQASLWYYGPVYATNALGKAPYGLINGRFGDFHAEEYHPVPPSVLMLMPSLRGMGHFQSYGKTATHGL